MLAKQIYDKCTYYLIIWHVLSQKKTREKKGLYTTFEVRTSKCKSETANV